MEIDKRNPLKPLKEKEIDTAIATIKTQEEIKGIAIVQGNRYNHAKTESKTPSFCLKPT